jgi:hypothetical protein
MIEVLPTVWSAFFFTARANPNQLLVCNVKGDSDKEKRLERRDARPAANADTQEIPPRRIVRRISSATDGDLLAQSPSTNPVD